jgi:SAM-dependent methyltransferase
VKSLYIRVVRATGAALRRAGILSRWERHPESRIAVWASSLFAIYDIDEMVRLDLPWWNLRATERVESLLAARPSARVLEFGSGASTVWLAKRADSVISIEHDEEWAHIVRRHISDRVDLRLVPADAQFDSDYASERRDASTMSFRDYASSIDSEVEPFDLIVIDGRARAKCLEHARAHLAPDGIVLFDDTGRARYRRAIAASGMHEERHTGLSACVPYPDSTSLLTTGSGWSAPATPSPRAHP